MDEIFRETGSSLKKKFLEYVFVTPNNHTHWGKMDVAKCLVHYRLDKAFKIAGDPKYDGY